MVSNNSRNSDLSSTEPHSISDRSQRNHNNNSSTMAVDGHLRSSNRSSESTLLGAQITVIDAPADAATTPKTVEDVWREIVSGNRKECKQEAPDELITLEDFLARAGASMEDADDVDVQVKVPPTEQRWSDRSIFALDPISQGSFHATEGSTIGFGNGAVEVISGRRKRPRSVLEPLDRAAQQRQRRMIKNRESAARSRERKQAYQVELESLAVRLENENMKLLKEKVERTKKRFKQLMEKVVPVVEKQGSARVLRRVRSLQW